MKRNDLTKALQLVSPALSSTDLVPALRSVKLYPGGIVAYNDMIGIEVELPIGVDCAVNGRLLTQLVATLHEECKLTMKKSELILEDGITSAKLPSLESYPFTFPEGEGESIELGAEFLAAIKVCLMSVSFDLAHPELVGVWIEAGKKSSAVYSTDNVTVTSVSGLKGFPMNDGLLLPREFCEVLVATAAALNQESMILVVAKDYFKAVFGDADPLTRILVKRPVVRSVPDFKAIFKQFNIKGSTYAPVTTDIKSAFDRSVIISEHHVDKVCTIEQEGGTVRLDTTGPVAHAQDYVKLEQPKFEKFVIDPRHVVRALPVASEICVSAPCLILRNEESNFLQLISHMKLTD